MNRVKRTCRHAASLSETSECTCLRSSVLHHIHHDTVLRTCIFIVFFCLFTCTRTFYKCGHVNSLTGFLSHDCSYLCGNRSSSYRTGVDRSFSLHNRRRKTRAARISTASTVVARKHACDSLFSLIYFHCELLLRYSKEDTDKQTYTTDNRGGNEYTCHIPFPPLNQT